MRSVLPLGNRSFFSPTFLSEVFGLNEDLSCDKDVVSSGGSFLFCRECNVSADLSPSLFAVSSTGLLAVVVNAFRFRVPLKKKRTANAIAIPPNTGIQTDALFFRFRKTFGSSFGISFRVR